MIVTLHSFLFLYLKSYDCSWKQDGDAFSCCLPHGFEFSFSWTSWRPRAYSILIFNLLWGREKLWIHAFFKGMSAKRNSLRPVYELQLSHKKKVGLFMGKHFCFQSKCCSLTLYLNSDISHVCAVFLMTAQQILTGGWCEKKKKKKKEGKFSWK